MQSDDDLMAGSPLAQVQAPSLTGGADLPVSPDNLQIHSVGLCRTHIHENGGLLIQV